MGLRMRRLAAAVMLAALCLGITSCFFAYGGAADYLYDFTDEQVAIIYAEFGLELPGGIRPRYLYYYKRGHTPMPIPGGGAGVAMQLAFATDEMEPFLQAYGLEDADALAELHEAIGKDGHRVLISRDEYAVTIRRTDFSTKTKTFKAFEKMFKQSKTASLEEGGVKDDRKSISALSEDQHLVICEEFGLTPTVGQEQQTLAYYSSNKPWATRAVGDYKISIYGVCDVETFYTEFENVQEVHQEFNTCYRATNRYGERVVLKYGNQLIKYGVRTDAFAEMMEIEPVL